MSKGKQEIFGMIPVRVLSKTTHNELIALCTISSFQGGNEYAFPSLDALAERSGITKQAFSKAATGLFKKGFINRKKRYGSTNIYFVVWHIEDLEAIKDSNKKVKKHKFKQSSESIGYLNQSDIVHPNNSDVDYRIQSDDIYKNNIKEHNTITEPDKIKSLTEQLKDLASDNSIAYTEDVNQDRLFQNKLMSEIANCTNDKILERANQYIAIRKNPKAPTWINSDKFGFKFLKFNWDRIEIEYNVNKQKSNVVKFERSEKEKPVFDSTDFDKMKGII